MSKDLKVKVKIDKKKRKGKKHKAVSFSESTQESGIRGVIKADTFFSRTVQRIEAVYHNLDIEREVDRLTSLHETRHIRKLSVKEVLSDQQTRLIEAELQNGAHRTTAVAIRVKLTRANYTIYDALKKLKKYLAVRYAAELRNEASTISERNAILDALLMDYDQWCSELEMALQISEDVIADHDSAGYSLLRITKVLELTRNPT